MMSWMVYLWHQFRCLAKRWLPIIGPIIHRLQGVHSAFLSWGHTIRRVIDENSSTQSIHKIRTGGIETFLWRRRPHHHSFHFVPPLSLNRVLPCCKCFTPAATPPDILPLDHLSTSKRHEDKKPLHTFEIALTHCLLVDWKDNFSCLFHFKTFILNINLVFGKN